MLFQVATLEEIRWMKLWNMGVENREEEGFPTHGMTYKDLDIFLHKATFE